MWDRKLDKFDVGSDLFSRRDWYGPVFCAQTDPDLYFAENDSVQNAKHTCNRCEVKGSCLEYALANDERYGIWGRPSERERRGSKDRGVS